MRSCPCAIGRAVVVLSVCAVSPAAGEEQPEPADLIVRNAKVTTLDDARPSARAFAVRGEKFVAVGAEDGVMQFRGGRTRVIDAGGRRVIPGLNDSHIHAVRGGRFYNLELRWDGVESLELGPDSAAPEGGRFEFTDGGAILHASPRPTILYTTIARLPQLSPEDQLNSTKHFYRELNRFGITSVVDPGGGGHAYPADYEASRRLAREPRFPLRISSYLFAQKAGAELEDYEKWTAEEKLDIDRAAERLHGYVVEGAGENLVASAGDFENFLAPRPELKENMERELEEVVRVLAKHGWPIRIHATYDQSITRVLDVFETVFRETGYEARWCIDHAETIGARNLARVKALRGGIAVQNRMAFAGEVFADRYGKEAASSAPPFRAILRAGIPVGAGTDATRVSSHNPWLCLYWMVTGKTAGGTQLASPENRLSREEALRLYTVGSAWFSGEEDVKGKIAAGQLGDFAILSADYMTLPEEEIRGIESVLTVTGGDIVHAADSFPDAAPEPLPPVSPAWSPVAHFGGYQSRRTARTPPR